MSIQRNRKLEKKQSIILRSFYSSCSEFEQSLSKEETQLFIYFFSESKKVLETVTDFMNGKVRL